MNDLTPYLPLIASSVMLGALAVLAIYGLMRLALHDGKGDIEKAVDAALDKRSIGRRMK